VATIDLTSARLVPAPGQAGWLCRTPSAVVWVPAVEDVGLDILAACRLAVSPTELLGRVASRLADPQAPPWPPFAILVARGPDIVAVVHGPAELMVTQEGAENRLYGGDEPGSWLNRLLHGPSAVSAGHRGGEGSPADLREGTVRAGGFLISAGADGRLGAQPSPAREAALTPGAAGAGRQGGGDVAGLERSGAPDRAAAAARGAGAEREAGSRRGSAVASRVETVSPESPTVVESALPVQDITVVEGPASRRVGIAVGRLAWDNGEVSEIRVPALVGRDVASDDGVRGGEVSAVVPGGQNDSMSRAHAELRIEGGRVVVVDRGSTNGTFVWDEGARLWHRLGAGDAHALTSGTVLAFGERTATFEGVADDAG